MKLSKNEKIRKILKPNEKHSIQNGSFCYLSACGYSQDTAGKGFLGWLQGTLKKYGNLYYTLLKIFSPVLPSRSSRKKFQELLAIHGEEHIILNLGSGPYRLSGRKDIINIDISSFDQVDIVSDASNLMILDETVDLIINNAMLEHVGNPLAVIDEMYRVLQKGGTSFCFLPFMQPYHAAPDDYYRWTIAGAKILFSKFDEVEVFVGAGPTSGFLWILQEWLAVLSSFGNKTLHDITLLIFMLFSAPLKLFDILLEKLPNAQNIASGFCIIAKKKKSM